MANETDRRIERAYKAYCAGDLATARVNCESVLQEDAYHLGALNVLSLVETQAKRYEEAAALIERLTAVRPKADTYQRLSQCLYYLGRLDDALRAADVARAMEEGNAGGHTIRAAILHGMERFAAALDAASLALQQDPSLALAWARAGAALDRLGRLGEAETCFRRAEQLADASKPYGVVTYDSAPLRVAYTGATASMSSILTSAVDADMVIFVCCDSRYFAKYGFAFVHSFAKNTAGTVLLHIHVLDNGAEPDQMLRELGKDVRGRVAISKEISPFANTTTSIAAHTFYSCSRFLHLADLLKHYQRPIVCLDVDAIIEKDLGALASELGQSDVGFTRRHFLSAPWLDIPAGILVAQPNQVAIAYFEAVRNYIGHHIRRGKLTWHLDQAACHCTLRMLQEHDASRSALSPSFDSTLPAAPKILWLSSEQQDRVWQLGHEYDDKLAQPRYKKYARQSP